MNATKSDNIRLLVGLNACHTKLCVCNIKQNRRNLFVIPSIKFTILAAREHHAGCEMHDGQTVFGQGEQICGAEPEGFIPATQDKIQVKKQNSKIVSLFLCIFSEKRRNR